MKSMRKWWGHIQKLTLNCASWLSNHLTTVYKVFGHLLMLALTIYAIVSIAKSTDDPFLGIYGWVLFFLFYLLVSATSGEAASLRKTLMEQHHTMMMLYADYLGMLEGLAKAVGLDIEKVREEGKKINEDKKKAKS